MKWEINFSGQARKQVKKMPHKVIDALNFLRMDIAESGPVQPSWPNYGKLKGREGYHHCHLNKGKPCYVAVWFVNKDKVNLVEVRYVGTHEKVDYRKIR